MTALLALPRWAKIGAAIVALAILLPVLKGCYDRGVIRDNERKVAAEVAATSSAASAQAGDAIAATRGEIEKGNDNARKAAAVSADPLGDGLRSLRAEGGADRAATGRADQVRR